MLTRKRRQYEDGIEQKKMENRTRRIKEKEREGGGERGRGRVREGEEYNKRQKMRITQQH